MLYRIFSIVLFYPLFITAQNFRDRPIWTFDVHFDFGKAEVRGMYLSRLDSLAVALLSDSNFIISLQAHTDAIGSDAANKLLSEQRAKNIESYLLAKNVEYQRIVSVAFGENQPIADNVSEDGRQNNRRVSVRLMRRIAMTTLSSIIKNDTGEVLVGAKVMVKSRYFKDSTVTDSTGFFKMEVPKNQNVIMDVTAKDHFFIRRNLIIQELPLKLIDLQLIRAIVGRKMKLNDMYFVGGQTTLLPTSLPELKSLLLFMQLNEGYKIEIQGHINAPDKLPVIPESTDFKLSVGRAKVVHDFLLQNGIPAERLTFAGYGNWFMVYPNAKTEAEQAANRRVEIKILEKN